MLNCIWLGLVLAAVLIGGASSFPAGIDGDCFDASPERERCAGDFSDLVKELGPDNLITRVAGTIYGSTETKFYVIAVYFGAVGIQRTRHAIPPRLTMSSSRTPVPRRSARHFDYVSGSAERRASQRLTSQSQITETAFANSVSAQMDVRLDSWTALKPTPLGTIWLCPEFVSG